MFRSIFGHFFFSNRYSLRQMRKKCFGSSETKRNFSIESDRRGEIERERKKKSNQSMKITYVFEHHLHWLDRAHVREDGPIEYKVVFNASSLKQQLKSHHRMCFLCFSHAIIFFLLSVSMFYIYHFHWISSVVNWNFCHFPCSFVCLFSVRPPLTANTVPFQQFENKNRNLSNDD